MPLLYILLPAVEVAPDFSPHEREMLRERVAALLAPYAVDLEAAEHDELCDCTLDPQVRLVDRLVSLGIALQVKESILEDLRHTRADLARGARHRALARCPICGGAGSYRSVRNPDGKWSRWALRDDPPWPMGIVRIVARPDGLLNRVGRWTDVWTVDDAAKVFGWHQDCVVVAVDYQP